MNSECNCGKQELVLARGNGAAEVERVPLGLTFQWPFIQLGRSFKNMADAYRRFVSISADDLRAVYSNRARQADECGDVEGFVFYMEKVVGIDDNDPDALYTLGLAYEKKKEHQAARKRYERVLQLDANNAKTRFRLGLMQLRENQVAAAIESFEAARQLAGDSADLFFRLGQAYDRLEQHAQAITSFNKAIELEPNHLRTYKHMALTYDGMKKHKKALECLKRALELEDM